MSADPRASGPGFIYLASQSPRRRELLDRIGVRHELLLADADEDVEALEATRDRESPEAYVERVTRAKLRAATATAQMTRWLRPDSSASKRAASAPSSGLPRMRAPIATVVSAQRIGAGTSPRARRRRLAARSLARVTRST